MWCTLVVEYLIRGHDNIQKLSLDALCQHYGLPPKKDLVKVYWDAGIQTDEIPADILQTYCEQDAANAMMIYKRQTDKALKLYKLIALEMESLKAFAEMEMNGMCVDLPTVEEYQKSVTEELEAADAELKELLGIDNLDSPAQKARGLFGGMEKVVDYEDVVDEEGQLVRFKSGARKGEVKQRKVEREVYFDGVGFDPVALQIPVTDAGAYSTGKGALALLKGKTPEQKRVVELLRLRSPLSKLKSGYFDAIPRIHINSKVHGNLNQALTTTGRLSCNNPNLQNIPSRDNRVKRCFISRF